MRRVLATSPSSIVLSMQIAVTQIGARRHYAIPAILERAGLLEGFYTDLCASFGPLRLARAVVPPRMQPEGLKRLLAREVDGVPRSKIRCFPRFGFARAMSRRNAKSPASLIRSYLEANERFGRLITRRGLDGADTVYGFNGAALEIFQYAKRNGMRTILEQTDAPVAVEEALLGEERQRWEGWEFEGARPEDWRPMADREAAEWRLADLIVCGSEYVREGVRTQSGPIERCAVVPYGAKREFFRTGPRVPARRELHVLFVGTVCLRKGVPYLMQAAQRLLSKPVVFRVVGPIQVADHAVAELGRFVELAGPVPRSAIAREYDWADVLVLPSISEGSANVCYEGLAAWLPVITTPNSGSVVRDGQEGYIIPIRDGATLAERIGRLAADRKLLRQLSENAAARAREFTWERYAERLVSAIGGRP